MRGRNLGRDIPVDSAPVVRLMAGKFTLAGHPFFAHWTQEPMPQKSNILEGCHSIPRRTTFLCRPSGCERFDPYPSAYADGISYVALRAESSRLQNNRIGWLGEIPKP